MTNKKRWNISEINNGYVEVKLPSWKYFFEFVHQEMFADSYIWRGQSNERWPLEPTLDRLLKVGEIPKKDRAFHRVKHLNNFKLASRGRKGIASLTQDNDWWALGQHHGLATPLLDWTSSPFVAAYFAFINSDPKQTSYRAVYALHTIKIKIKIKELNKKETDNRIEGIKIKEKEEGFNPYNKLILETPIKPDIEFINPMSDENHRLVNQGGLFTKSPGDIDMKSWILKNFINDTTQNVLLKIRIPNKDMEDCLTTLNRMNINHLTLFPDLSGASKFCNLSTEIKEYKL
jgi:hypothetical protein